MVFHPGKTDRACLAAKMRCASLDIVDIANGVLPNPTSYCQDNQLGQVSASFIHIEEQAWAIVYCAFPMIWVVLVFNMPAAAGHRTYSTTYTKTPNQATMQIPNTVKSIWS